jgi:hypothetical protein
MLGGDTLTMRADLVGEYGRERHGGGRFGWTSESDEELWRIHVGVAGAELEALAPTHRAEWILWRGDDRDAGEAILEGLSLVTCPASGAVAFGVTGFDVPRWSVVRAGDGWGFQAPWASDATDCASFGDVPDAPTLLRAVRDDALRAWVEMEQTGPPMPREGLDRRYAGKRACGVHLDRGEAEETLACLWELRIGSHEGGELVDLVNALIAEGPAAEPDLEAAMFRLAAPGGLPGHEDPAIAAVIEDHVAFAMPGYLARATTAERRQAFESESEASR